MKSFFLKRILALLVCIYKEAETVKDQRKQSEELSEVIIQGNGFS